MWLSRHRPGEVSTGALDQDGHAVSAAPVAFAAPDLDHIQPVGDLSEGERAGGHGSQIS